MRLSVSGFDLGGYLVSSVIRPSSSSMRRSILIFFPFIISRAAHCLLLIHYSDRCSALQKILPTSVILKATRVAEIMLAAASLALHSSLIWTTIGIAFAQDNPPGKIDCYGWAGNAISNNTQCPGSNTCCLITDYCDPNRFCRQDKQIIIPPCAVTPWSDCANICQYGEFTYSQRRPVLG